MFVKALTTPSFPLIISMQSKAEGISRYCLVVPLEDMINRILWYSNLSSPSFHTATPMDSHCSVQFISVPWAPARSSSFHSESCSSLWMAALFRSYSLFSVHRSSSFLRTMLQPSSFVSSPFIFVRIIARWWQATKRNMVAESGLDMMAGKVISVPM